MSSSLKTKYLLLFIASAIFFLVMRLPYRKFIYQQGHWDLHIADTAPNFLAVLLFVFYKKCRGSVHSNQLLVSGAFLGLLLYELMIQTHIYDATIDVLDIIASLVGSSFAFLVCYYLDNKGSEVLK